MCSRVALFVNVKQIALSQPPASANLARPSQLPNSVVCKI